MILADIHCHLLPYVDDGAELREISLQLLKMEYEQGVRVICCTPHLRKGMFESSDEAIINQYMKFRECAKTMDPSMRVFLSREYHCDALFSDALQNGRILPLGKGRRVLIEFSNRFDETGIIEFTKKVISYGYKPLIAHVERYDAMCQSLDQTARLIDLGAKIQVNAGSILGREGHQQSHWVLKLLKQKLVHVVASDAHDPESRPPELAQCAAYLEKKVGSVYTQELMYTNPLLILNES